jgi:hypothetical protein
MRRKMGLLTPILLVVAVFFFLMLGISILAHTPSPDANLTPSLAADANETEAFRAPVVLGWQGAALATVVCGGLAAAGMVVRSLRGGRRR